MIFYIFKSLDTAVEIGEWSKNTMSVRGILKQIFVKFDTSSTIFDVTITDSDDLVIFERIGETGEINELIDLPLNGIYTVAIENATVDEDFNLKFYILEQ